MSLGNRLVQILRYLWIAYRRMAAILVGAFILLALAIGLFPDRTLKWVGDIWSVTEKPPERADAILVLGGGNSYRPQAAADLWKNQNGAAIFVFNAKDEFTAPQGNGVIRILVEEQGVPRDAIVLVNSTVSSTLDEAVATGKLVSERGLESIIVPTNPFHSRRTRWIFSKHLPDECELFVTDAPSNHFRAEDWWKNEWGTVNFVNEMLKSIYYWFRY